MTESFYPEEYLEFIRLFNGEKFFEAHEILESLWRREKGRSKDFYHGLIQIAAAFVHIQKGTPAGAHELFRKASSYLAPFSPAYLELDLKDLLAKTREALLGHAPFPRIYLR